MWIVTIISLIGSALNARKSIICFYVWILANICWLVYDIHVKLYSRAVLDTVQTLLCISGIIYWRKEKQQ